MSNRYMINSNKTLNEKLAETKMMINSAVNNLDDDPVKSLEAIDAAIILLQVVHMNLYKEIKKLKS